MGYSLLTSSMYMIRAVIFDAYFQAYDVQYDKTLADTSVAETSR
jgi:hypothetical protein